MNEKIAWSPQRAAELGFMVGQGFPCERVATEFGVSAGGLQRQANRLGLKFRQGRQTASRHALARAAAKRGITEDELQRMLLDVIDEDPCLIDHLLCDLSAAAP